MGFELLLALLIVVALVLYLVFGGADFGAGVWEFNTALGASERERNLLYKAIGPVWETNHVWLIFVLVLLFGSFPSAYGAINEALIVPLLLGLIGIVFRGAAYAFRSQLKSEPSKQKVWIAVFAISSVMAPFFLGAAVGAIASGQLQFDEAKIYSGSYLVGWVNPLSVFCGFFTVGICVYLSATFMIREASIGKQHDLQLIWRKRALACGIALGMMALVGLLIVWFGYPHLHEGFWNLGWPAIFASFVLGNISVWAVYTHRLMLGPICVAATSACVVIGWCLAQYPYILPNAWTIQESAAHPNVLKLTFGVSVAGLIFLLPAIALLFKIFKSDEGQAS